MAVGFTTLLNVLLAASLVYSEWLPLKTQLTGYGALAFVWLLSRWQSRTERRASLAVDSADEQQDESTEAVPVERDVLFREAQGHYLRNDWVATEQLLLKLLKQDARDLESRLMLATLWRHQGRGAEALRQLDRLQRFEAAEQWQHEIAAERMAIEAASEVDAANEELEDVVTVDIDDARPEQTEAEAIEETDDRRRAA